VNDRGIHDDFLFMEDIVGIEAGKLGSARSSGHQQ
jgi:hypothetical protein